MVKNTIMKNEGKVKNKRKSKVEFRRGEEKSLFPLLTSKPCQGRKTVEIFNQRSLNINDNTLNVMISQNFKNQANQLENRAKQEDFHPDIGKYIKDHESKLWVLHGNKDKSKEADSFMYGILCHHKKDIICLSNPTRLKVLCCIIQKWFEHNNMNKVLVSLDEADKTFKAFDKYIISEIGEENIRNGRINIHFVSASCENLSQQVKKIYNGFTISERSQNLDNYISIMDIPWNHREWVTYEDILNDYKRDNSLINEEDYIFWPMDFRNDCQSQACEEIIEQIDCTIILENGKGYHIYCRDKDGIWIRTDRKNSCPKSKPPCGHLSCSRCNPETAGDHIKYIKEIKSKYAKNKPLILCGNLCVGRAMTLHMDEFPFTKAFYSEDIKIGAFGRKNSNADIYQLAARILGSFKNELRIKGKQYSVAYGNIEFRNIILREENAARYLSDMKGGSIIDKEDMDKVYNGEEIEPKSIDETLENSVEKYQYSIELDDTDIKTIRIKINDINKKLHIKAFQEKTLSKVIEGNSTEEISMSRENWTINFENPRNTFKYENKSFRVTPIDRDGDCLFNSVVKSGLIDISNSIEMRKICTKEYISHEEKYKGFIPNKDILEIIDDIKTPGKWDTDIHDLMPILIASIYNLKIEIYDFTYDSFIKKYIISNIHSFPVTIIPHYGENNKMQTIYLFRTNDNNISHYDLMIPNNIVRKSTYNYEIYKSGGICLFEESECNDIRKKISEDLFNRMITTNNKGEPLRVNNCAFQKLPEKNKIGNLFKHKNEKTGEVKIWEPQEISTDHTKLCGPPKNKNDLHSWRCIERVPTYKLVNGIKQLRFMIFYYNGVQEVEV